MKKILALLLVSVLCLSAVAFCSCTIEGPSIEIDYEEPFEVGSDEATYEVDGHSEWAGQVTANVRIIAGETVLFNGKVTVTSDSLYASEFFIAACLEKDLTQEGLEQGFVTTIGEYTNDTTTNTYWMWNYNAKTTNFACNDVHVFDNDYITYSFEVSEW